jgi:hypothetical protein
VASTTNVEVAVAADVVAVAVTDVVVVAKDVVAKEVEVVEVITSALSIAARTEDSIQLVSEEA